MRSLQASSCAWKSSGFEAPASLEVAVNEPVIALERALRLAITGREDDPADRKLPAESRERVGRAPAAGVDRALAVPDQLARQRVEPAQATVHAPRDVAELLGEDQRAGERTRVRQLAGHHPAAAGLAPADGDLRAWLAQIELRQLPRPITRALKAARRRQKPRPQLAQQVIEDRLAAHVAELLQLLTHPHPDSVGSSPSNSSITTTNGSSIDGRGSRGP